MSTKQERESFRDALDDASSQFDAMASELDRVRELVGAIGGESTFEAVHGLVSTVNQAMVELGALPTEGLADAAVRVRRESQIPGRLLEERDEELVEARKDLKEALETIKSLRAILNACPAENVIDAARRVMLTPQRLTQEEINETLQLLGARDVESLPQLARQVAADRELLTRVRGALGATEDEDLVKRALWMSDCALGSMSRLEATAHKDPKKVVVTAPPAQEPLSLFIVNYRYLDGQTRAELVMASDEESARQKFLDVFSQSTHIHNVSEVIK